MNILSETKRVLLATAAERENGSILPLPAKLKPSGGVKKAIASLLMSKLAIKRAHDDPAAIYEVSDEVEWGVFLTAEGLKAVGIAHEPSLEIREDQSIMNASSVASKRATKKDVVLKLLKRVEGATLPELTEATGWLPHTMRAALTGLRKKGYALTRGKRDGVTCYRAGGLA